MPEITRFNGIVIRMYLKPKEHEPAHIHAYYGEKAGEFNILTATMEKGDLSIKEQSLVKEWLLINQMALLRMWKEQSIRKLPPLR